MIDAWLMSEDTDIRNAGIIATGVCRDVRFADRLKALLSTSGDDATLLLVLDSLRNPSASRVSTPWWCFACGIRIQNAARRARSLPD
jgi:hypothetical protein